jgi:hypothetical protein
LGRLDINLSDKHRLWFDARHNYRFQEKDPYFNNVANGYTLQRINQGAFARQRLQLFADLLMDVRGNWTRFITIGAIPAMASTRPPSAFRVHCSIRGGAVSAANHFHHRHRGERH